MQRTWGGDVQEDGVGMEEEEEEAEEGGEEEGRERGRRGKKEVEDMLGKGGG